MKNKEITASGDVREVLGFIRALRKIYGNINLDKLIDKLEDGLQQRKNKKME